MMAGLFLVLPAFVSAKEEAKTNPSNPLQEDSPYYKNKGFELDFHGEAHFSARYVENKDYFALENGVNHVDVLVDNNDALKNDANPSTATGVQKLSDGGILGNYHDNFVIANGIKFSIHAKNKPSEKVAYGTSAEINLETDSARRLVTNYAYMFLDTGYGRFEAGNYQSAADSMKLDASSIATIDGGITNNWIFSANTEGRHINANFAGSGSSENKRNRNVQRPFMCCRIFIQAITENI